MLLFKFVVAVHVLGATVWAGGHLVLAVAVLPRALRANDPKVIQDFEHGFERLAVPALILQVLTGVWLAWQRLPDLVSWFSFGSPLATHIFLKIVLLAGTLGLAIDARLRIHPQLERGNLKSLAWHVVLVTLLAVLLVLVGVGLRFT